MLVGRDVALRAADAAVASALTGRGRLLLVGGEAGIGKTTVAREVADRADAVGARVRWGACWESGSLLPFAPWIDALRRPGGDGCATLSERLAEGVSAAAPDAASAARARLRLFADVVDTLAEASASQPQVLLLEDLHWADSGTLELLQALAPHLPAMATLVVATYRDDELDLAGPLAGLGGGAEWLALQGLPEEAVASLLEEVLGHAPPPDEVSAVHRRTAGNPLFIIQVARLIALGSTGVPVGVRDVLARRLARLSEASDRVVAAAAVLGPEFAVTDVAAVADRPEADVVAALEDAGQARLMQPLLDRPGRWMFVHELMRAVRYEALGTGERAQLHRRALDVLEHDPATSAAVLAHHAVRARFAPDDTKPAQITLGAAREALARMAWHEAATLAERAFDAAPTGVEGDRWRAEALLVQGDAHLRSGADEHATAAFEGAAALARRHELAEVLARAALGFAAGLGGFEVRIFDRRQVALLEEAAGALPEDSPLRPLVLARLSVALSLAGSDDRRLALADEAVRSARARGDHAALAAAIASRCDAIAGPDHVAERLGAATEIVALAQRAADPELELLGRRLRAVALLELRDLAGFDAEVLQYAHTADRLGDPLYAWCVPLWRAMRAHADGRLEEAEQLAAEARRIGESGGSRNATLLHRFFTLCLAADRRDVTPIDAAWDEILSVFPELMTFPYYRITSAWLDTEKGRVDSARARLAEMAPGYVDGLPFDQEWLATLAQLVLAASGASEEHALRAAYELLQPYEGIGVFEGIGAIDRGVVDRFLALAAGHLRDRAALEHHAEAAVAAGEAAGRLIAAQTISDCARAFAAAGEGTRAGELARDAIARYEALGLDSRAHDLAALAGPTPSPPPAAGGQAASLVREGDSWAVTYAGDTVRVRHAKGIADLAVLLARPGAEVHVRVLEGAADVAPSSAQPALDDRAVTAYRDRLRDLEEELDEADRHADIARLEKLTAERDALVAEITRSFGLGGRRRAAGSDPDERLRKAVSARVKASIDRLERMHPALGRHLRNSVRTGYVCSYEPEQPVSWHVESGRPG